MYYLGFLPVFNVLGVRVLQCDQILCVRVLQCDQILAKFRHLNKSKSLAIIEVLCSFCQSFKPTLVGKFLRL